MDEGIAAAITNIIAGAALGVGSLSWWASRKSANAAERSAASAERALPVAEQAAQAAEKSAAAALRTVELTEDTSHRNAAPKWSLSVETTEETFVIKAVYKEGPPGVIVDFRYRGEIFKPATETSQDGAPVYEVSLYEYNRARNEPLEIPVKLPEGWQQIARMELRVVLLSRLPDSDPGEAHNPWVDQQYIERDRESVIIW
ncbi:hypothetical protein [Saccharopolyspora erythraea]|uniref:Secreted protein n=1 Tax=Saccharopolyspora erythraea TaxID=1836 RepID=A0ABN1D2N2_SACER|nr:hypothetical protein [Saccharopolyspora erythraea]QRK91040.1 hypothetical protein JQX30_06250 [Saccharopolyspora erythraea]